MLQQPGRAFRHYLDGPLFRKILAGGVRALPLSLQHLSVPGWAALFFALLPSLRRGIASNLDQILGKQNEPVRTARAFRVFVNYCQSMANVYSLRVGHRVPIEPHFVGREKLLQHIQQTGTGAIMLTGHMGYWQISPYLMQKKHDLPPMTMAMAEEPNQGSRAFEDKLREKMRIVYTTRSPFVMLELAAILKRGELVGMQLDRHVGTSHMLIDFCGRPAPFPVGPATLARATGAPLMPVFVLGDSDRRRCTFHYETPISVEKTRDRQADIRRGTEAVVRVYERYVRQHPYQWFNFHDFWQSPPPPQVPVVSEAQAG